MTIYQQTITGIRLPDDPTARIDALTSAVEHITRGLATEALDHDEPYTITITTTTTRGGRYTVHGSAAPTSPGTTTGEPVPTGGRANRIAVSPAALEELGKIPLPSPAVVDVDWGEDTPPRNLTPGQVGSMVADALPNKRVLVVVPTTADAIATTTALKDYITRYYPGTLDRATTAPAHRRISLTTGGTIIIITPRNCRGFSVDHRTTIDRGTYSDEEHENINAMPATTSTTITLAP